MKQSDSIAYSEVLPFESESLDPEALHLSESEISRSSGPPHRVFDCLHRLCILVTGLFLGFATFMPNGMMGDSGTRLATTFAMIGVSASALFCVAGIVGAFTKKWNLYKYACGLQLLALSPMIIVTAWSLIRYGAWEKPP